MSPAHRSRCRERGSATVLVMVLVVTVTAVAVGCTVIGGLLVRQRETAAAADLAALAGAAALQQRGHGCVAAATVAESNGGRLRGCRVVGETVTVEVASRADLPFGASVTVRSWARAGPGE